jgi:hypothetical protein
MRKTTLTHISPEFAALQAECDEANKKPLFDIRKFTDRLPPTDQADYHGCASCDRPTLFINPDNGAYSCSSGCDELSIRSAILAFGDATATIGLLADTTGRKLQKTITLGGDGSLVKKSAATPYKGVAKSVDAATAADLATLITRLKPNQALWLGTSGHPIGEVVPVRTKENVGNTPGAIARSKDFLHWPGGEFWLLIDVDPEPGAPRLSADQHWALACELYPELAQCAHVVVSSSASHIANTATGETLVGEGNYHIYVRCRGAVADFTVDFKRRAWLTEKAFYKFATTNAQTGVASLLERFCFDVTVWSPERVIYEAGADVALPLAQTRPGPIAVEGKTWDLDQIAPLTLDQIATADQLRDAAKAAMRGDQIDKLSESIAAAESMPPKQARAEAVRRIDAADRSVLSHSHIIHVDGLGAMQAGDLTPEHHGLRCLDPQEPDYRPGDYGLALIYHNRGHLVIQSQAHGGITYTLATAELTAATLQAAITALKLAEQGDTEPGLAVKPLDRDDAAVAAQAKFLGVNAYKLFRAYDRSRKGRGIDWLVANFFLDKQDYSAAEKAHRQTASVGIRVTPWDGPIVQNYAIGVMETRGSKKDRYDEFVPKLACDFTVIKELEAPDGGRLVLKVQFWEGIKLQTKNACLRSIDCVKSDKFAEALVRALGRRMTCNLNNTELCALIQNRTQDYYLAGGQSYRLADRVGRQEGGYWIFEDCQFDPQGKPCTEEDSRWVFNHELGETLKIPSPKIAPQSPDALPNLIRVLEGFYPAETFPLTLFSLGYGALTLHHTEIIKAEGGCPQLAMFGDAGGGKTLAAMAASSITGMHRTGLAAGFSTSLFYEYAKSFGGLLILLDDAVKKGRDSDKVRDHVTNLLWAMYGALARRVQKNVQQPHTNAVATTNVALAEDNQAAESRLLKLYFPSGKFSEDAAIKAGIEEALDGASGGLGQLIGIPYDRAAIKDLKARLLEFLPNAHNRIAGSLALITYFTQKFCDVAGYQFDAFDYCKNNLCPDANAGESGKDSLTGFIEGLAILKSEGVVGEWNMTQVIRRDGSKYLAVNLAAVFPTFDSKFHPNYTRQSIQNLIKGIYPDAYTNASFAASKAEWQDYERAQASFKRGEFSQMPIVPSKTNSTKCWLIPQSIIDQVWGHDSGAELDPLTNSFSAYPSDAIEPTPSVTQEATESTFTQIEAEEIENCLTIAETAAAASPEAVSTAWQMLRQLPDERLKKAVWHRLSVAARNAIQQANEDDRLGIWEVAT